MHLHVVLIVLDSLQLSYDIYICNWSWIVSICFKVLRVLFLFKVNCYYGTMAEGFSFKALSNIVLPDAKNSFPLTKDSQKQHPMNCSQRSEQDTFSLPQRTKISLSVAEIGGTTSSLHHFHCDIFSAKMCVLSGECFVNPDCYTFHSSRHWMWFCSLIL